MSSNEERAPLDAASVAVTPANDETPTEAIAERAAAGSTANATAHPHDELSPAVRRLVRQFDLDITGIHGTGPSGRIRVGDVMGLLNGRTDTGNRDAPPRPLTADDEATLDDDLEGDGVEPAPALAAHPLAETGAYGAIPTSTVFDCDLSRVLSHRKKQRVDDNAQLLTTSYVLTALAAALDATPEITAGEPPRFGVQLTTTGGELRSAFLDTAAVSWDTALGERVRAVDGALRANLDTDVIAANLLVHYYGESGSLLVTPTPIGAGHAAGIGIGRVRREIVVRSVDGVEAPRVAARCYLTLSFLVDRLPLHRANRVMADVVRVLEQWPE